jgi:hypothetical protein
MGTVYQFSSEDWLTMKMLKGAICFMQERNSNGEYSLSMKQEKQLLSDYINGRTA